MKKGYLAKEMAKNEMDSAKRLMLYWVIVLVLAPLLIYAARYFTPSAPTFVYIIQLALAIGLLIIIASTVFFIVHIIKVWIKPERYSNLAVYADGIGILTAGVIIDAEAERGEFLVEEYIHHLTGRRVSQTKKKIVLLPSFLLISVEEGSITAIPTDKIYWICIQVNYVRGYPMGTLKIFYDRKIQEIENVEFLHTFYTIEKIQQYIPNVFYAYNPFLFSYELEGIFHKDYHRLVRIYNQHKEDFDKQQNSESEDD